MLDASEDMAGRLDNEIIHRLFALVGRMRVHFKQVAAEFELTPMQGLALQSLDEPVQMSWLAAQLGCERSNVTLLVDRLERRGLVERRADPDNRRVKLLAITEEGRLLRRRMEQRLFEAVPGLADLEAGQRETLRDLLAVMVPDPGDDCRMSSVQYPSR